MFSKRMSAAFGLFLMLSVLVACKAQDSPAEDTEQDQPAMPQESAELPLLEEEIPITTELYAIGLGFPTRMTWAPDGTLYVAEKGGNVRVITPDGELLPDPLISIDVNQDGEQGLLGLTVDPTFEETGYMWVFFSANDEETGEIWHRIGRFQVINGQGVDLQVGWQFHDAFQESTILNGGDVKFGPDGMLYVSAGSTNNMDVVNDANQPQGKVLRFTPTIPMVAAPDNPFEGSPMYSFGLRNTFAITFHPDTGVMYGSENGPDCDDEINRLLPGRNYGWRLDGLCEDDNLPEEFYPSRYEAPITNFTPTVSPTGLTFYTGDVFEQWDTNTLLFCVYKFGFMYFLQLDEETGVDIVKAGVVNTGNANCAVDITTGPDGYIYFSDINAIYRLVPG